MKLQTTLSLTLFMVVTLAAVTFISITPQPTQQLAIGNFSQPLESPLPTPGTALPVSKCIFSSSEIVAPTELEVSAQSGQTSLSNYALGEPRVVLTHTDTIQIGQWLQDNKSLLITKHMGGRPEPIEILDTSSGQEYVIAQSNFFGSQLRWLENRKAVVYMDRTLDQAGGTHNVIRVAQAQDTNVQTVAEGVTSPFSVDDTGDAISYFVEDKPGQIVSHSLKNGKSDVTGISLPIYSQVYLTENNIYWASELNQSYQTIWGPGNSRLAAFNPVGFYLIEPNKKDICQVDLGTVTEYGPRWVIDAQWSPNGHYIALITTAGETPVSFLDLTILNVVTGQQKFYSLNEESVYSLQWSNNSKHLLLALHSPDELGLGTVTLSILDPVSGESISSEHEFLSSTIAWSPSNNSIAVSCPQIQRDPFTVVEGRICVIDILGQP